MNLWFNIPFATMLMAAALSKIPEFYYRSGKRCRGGSVSDFKADDFAADLSGYLCSSNVCVYE